MEGGVPAEVEFRMLLIAVVAAAIGLAAGFIAFLLYGLIGLFTNMAFFHRASFALESSGGRRPAP
ncbi:MAG: hypothetical protein ACE14L_02110 [Terriglobales bacterium]